MSQPVESLYTYGFAHMSLRDQVVFKSIVGLLGGRTRARWQHVEQGPADLLVEGEEDHGAASTRIAPSQLLLHVGGHPTSECLQVHWPLRASEVFECLQQAAARIGQRRAPADMPLRLTRWPTTEHLRGDARFIRLATLLLGRSMSLQELVARSGVEPGTCEAFVAALAGADLLREEQAAAAPVAAAAPLPGLFARIRRHLGLHETEQKRA
jgi:hypothetical protein